MTKYSGAKVGGKGVNKVKYWGKWNDHTKRSKNNKGVAKDETVQASRKK